MSDMLERLNKALRITSEGNYRLLKKNEELRKALEFYAMPEHVWVRSAALAADKGFTARKALGLEK